MSSPSPLRLFEGFGVELEYMIVDRETLSVLPITDRVLHAVAGAYDSEIEVGPLCWSNELVLHVIELKTNGPARSLDGLAATFNDHVGRINELLAPLGGRLMPTAMHPWFDPHADTRIWPHEFSPIYEAYNRIFNCQGHGWSNLQSVHINLPFGDDEEFGRLHAAIRLILPILPALAASSPLMDLRATGILDNRLEVYRNNAARIPSITGRVIPEPVFSRGDYDREIFQEMYRDIAPYDPEGVLKDEFLNSRGAIARFSRQTIEIRVIDIQECPAADLAITALVVETLRALVDERWCSLQDQKAWATEPLAEILLASVLEGESALISNVAYLELFALRGVERCRAGDLWRHVADQVLCPENPASRAHRPALDVILNEGTLARRILRAVGEPVTRERITAVYRELCRCLRINRMFRGQEFNSLGKTPGCD